MRQICSLSPLKAEARGLQVQCLPGLQGEFKTSMGSLAEASSQNRKTDKKRSHDIEKVKGWPGEGLQCRGRVLSQRV